MADNLFNRAWKAIAHAGTTPSMPPELAFRIRAANVWNLILFLSTLSFINPKYGWGGLNGIYYALMALYVSAYLLTRSGRHRMGRALSVLIGGSVAAIPFTLYVQPVPNEFVHHYRIYMTTTLAFPATLFLASERFLRILTTVPILILLFGFNSIDEAIQWVDNPVPGQELLKAIKQIQMLSLLNAAIVMVLYIPYVQSTDEKLVRRFYKEKEKSEELMAAQQGLEKALEEAETARRLAESASKAVEESKVELEKRNQALDEAKKELEYSLALSRRDRDDLKRREFIESAVAKLGNLLQVDDGVETRQWAEVLLQTLVPTVGGEQAALYFAEDADNKKLLIFGAGYAIPDRSKVGLAIAFGHGMAGEAALSGQKKLVVNDENLRVRLRAGVSSLPVHSLLVLPLVYNGKVEGVLEIASLQAFTEANLEILDRFAPNLAVALLNIRNRKNIRRLYEEAQSRAEQLAAQEEELRQNLEELAATQDEMQRIQDSLSRQSARISAVIDNTPELIYAIDRDYRLTMFNQTFIDVIVDGYGRRPEIGENVFEFVYEENRAVRKAEYDRALMGEAFVQQSTIVEESGNEYYENAFTPIRDEQNNVVGVSVFRRDITHRVRAELEVEQSRAELQKLNRELEDRVENRTRALRETLAILKDSEKRLSTIIEQFPLGFALFSPNGELILTNPAFFRITGRNLPENYNLFHDPEEKRREIYLREVFSGNAVEMPVVPFRRGRETVMVKTFAFPITDENDRLKQVVLLYDDVTEEWAAADELKASESRFRNVVERFPLAMRFYLPDGTPLSDNPAYVRFWESRRPEYFGVKLQDDPVWTENGLSLESVFGGEACEFPPIAYRLKNETLWVKTYFFPLFTTDGRIREIVLVQQDVSDVKRAEEAYAQANAVLRNTLAEMEAMRGRVMRSDKMVVLGQMTAGVIHEISSPLSAVSASVEVAYERYRETMHAAPQLWGDLGDEKQAFFVLLQRALDVAVAPTGREERQWRKNMSAAFDHQALVADDDVVRRCIELGLTPDDIAIHKDFFSIPKSPALLDWLSAVANVKRNLENARLATDKARALALSIKRYTHATDRPTAEIVDLAQNIKDVLNIYSYKLKSLDVETDLSPVVLVSAFAGELSQVWTNLLANALQAVENTPEPRLTISLKNDEQTAVVTVADNGPGVPPELQSRIFDPFFTTKKQGEGTGLGLSLCKRIIERHGGTLTLYSMPGETRFVARLPLDYPARPEVDWSES